MATFGSVAGKKGFVYVGVKGAKLITSICALALLNLDLKPLSSLCLLLFLECVRKPGWPLS